MNQVQRVWEVVRKLRTFTAREVAGKAAVNTVDTFCILGGLERFGVVGGGPGKLDFDAKWTLHRDVGPLAPGVKHLAFWHDPNSGELRPYDDQVMLELRTIDVKDIWPEMALGRPNE